MREAAQAASAYLFSVPEYAHGIPGTFKNALDWLVGTDAAYGKPAAIWTTKSRSRHVLAHLREVLTTMALEIVDDACLVVDLPEDGSDSEEALCSPKFELQIQSKLQILTHAASFK